MPLITYNSAAMSSKISEIDKVESNYKQSSEEIDGYIQQIQANWKGTDADIAKEVFGDQDSIFFCTDAADESLEVPLGEWP